MKNQEQRRRSRVKFKTAVDIEMDSKTLRNLPTKDLSLKGMYVEIASAIPLDTSCKIAMKLSSGSLEIILHLTGKVARSEKSGIGIEFDTMDADSFQHLRKIVSYNADDPEKALREIVEIPFNKEV